MITVRPGFVTDFVSVPWFARPFIPTMGRAAKAAVLHDWLLEMTDRPKPECDEIFHEALGVLDVDPIRAWLMYRAVRLVKNREGLV